MLHDVFICHASEDKHDFVRPLAEALIANHVAVWYDEFTLNVGDSIREAIDRGLASSRFGIVVLSPSFFQKRWPNRELNGLVARETEEDRRLILPVWHDVDRSEVVAFSPPLADVWAASSTSGMTAVVSHLLKKIRPEDSPLIVARDILIEKQGVPPPVITDEWWLDIIEIKEAVLLNPELSQAWRWIFPLSYPDGARGKERGSNIAWTALQLDWAVDAQERKICQLTPPEEVHTFIRQWPGLKECAYQYPATLALYAPQITIPGFDNGFADVFDELNSPEKISECRTLRYGSPETTDGNNPLCGDHIAWRHPAYGNYTASDLSYTFVTAHSSSYFRQLFNGFECLVWLLSSNADWMPDRLKELLKQGFKDSVSWWISDIDDYGKPISKALSQPKENFSYTKSLKEELIERCGHALHVLEIDEDPKDIAAYLIELEFIEGYFNEQERIMEARKSAH